ncbi:hypothetical protein SAMN05216226_103263 [Halovenus aranensis]|uniref:Uncharacterized protein n=1 Tax=Halovenus aranensis TaxID=890420 RepID=A0A1G8TW68_9EURY|nr:hypothetical protein [Halovenus aranensis]SDJ45145.1 hypothetical protein SAMN05216226_103263 [Halovenus aranensis]
MSNDTDHANQPSDDLEDLESYYDDLDDGAGCVEIWEHIDDRRDD